MTISSQGTPLAAGRLLLSRQDFLYNHHERVPITPHQQGRMEMRDEALSSIGAQDKVTSGYQVSDLDEVEMYWEKDQQDVNAVFRLGVDTPFPVQLETILRRDQWLRTRF